MSKPRSRQQPSPQIRARADAAIKPLISDHVHKTPREDSDPFASASLARCVQHFLRVGQIQLRFTHRRLDSQAAKIVRNRLAGLATLEICIGQVEIQAAVRNAAVDQKLILVRRIGKSLLCLGRVAFTFFKRGVVTIVRLGEQRLLLLTAELNTATSV